VIERAIEGLVRVLTMQQRHESPIMHLVVRQCVDASPAVFVVRRNVFVAQAQRTCGTVSPL
jgi:hypothetical protein